MRVAIRVVALLFLCVYIPASSLAQSRVERAILRGTETTAPGTPTNINQATAFSIVWSSSSFDSTFLEHSTSTDAEKLTIKRAGEYLVAVTIPMFTALQRSSVQAEIYSRNAGAG